MCPDGDSRRAFKTMIDCSAAGQTEELPVDRLIAQVAADGKIAHVQVNDPNRRAPGRATWRSRPSWRRSSAAATKACWRSSPSTTCRTHGRGGVGIAYLRGVAGGRPP